MVPFAGHGASHAAMREAPALIWCRLLDTAKDRETGARMAGRRSRRRASCVGRAPSYGAVCWTASKGSGINPLIS